MAAFTCPSCNLLLHARLRARLSFLASLRSKLQSRSLNLAPKPSQLAYYWDTVPPTESQLAVATHFITTHPPRKLWTANEWRKRNEAEDASKNGLRDPLIPEVAFLGRSNVGKSSLLNALLQAPELNRVGPRPGKTTTMHAWGLSASDPKTGGAGPGGEMKVRLAVLDMPGYGHASREEWGKEVVTYLRRRKQLRRAFVLIDPLHGIKSTDEQMVELLRKEGISHQVIVSKADRLLETSKGAGNSSLQAFFELVRSEIVQPDTGKGVDGLGEILAVGNLAVNKKTGQLREQDMLGIDRVRWAVLVAAGLEEWATKRASASLSKKNRINSMGDESRQDKEMMVPWSPNDHRLDDRKQASSAPNQTHDSSSPASFPISNNEAKAGAGRTPFFASSKSTSASSPTTEFDRVSALAKLDSRLILPTKEVKQHEERMPPPTHLASFQVGGLAELEAQLPSKFKTRSSYNHKGPPSDLKSSRNDREAAGSSRARKPVKMSENLKKRLALKQERTGNKTGSRRAAGTTDEDYQERGRNFPATERMGFSRGSPPAPPPFTAATKYASSPSAGMQNGKGVGGMADLLASSSSSSSSSSGYYESGSGSGRGRGIGRGRKPRDDRRDPQEKWKKKRKTEPVIRKRRGRARGKFKAEAKARALARPDNVGW